MARSFAPAEVAILGDSQSHRAMLRSPTYGPTVPTPGPPSGKGTEFLVLPSPGSELSRPWGGLPTFPRT